MILSAQPALKFWAALHAGAILLHTTMEVGVSTAPYSCPTASPATPTFSALHAPQIISSTSLNSASDATTLFQDVCTVQTGPIVRAASQVILKIWLTPHALTVLWLSRIVWPAQACLNAWLASPNTLWLTVPALFALLLWSTVQPVPLGLSALPASTLIATWILWPIYAIFVQIQMFAIA